MFGLYFSLQLSDNSSLDVLESAQMKDKQTIAKR